MSRRNATSFVDNNTLTSSEGLTSGVFSWALERLPTCLREELQLPLTDTGSCWQTN
ncbi:Putative protein tag-76 [Caenorhabditis elegans]|uniref:Isoform c of Putative protein tag-76 n=1 Tax=Caenorhabditis elegans TaxID=6239 RepID=P34681-3|nr:Putative protein tag-76 [Caenorhabditis elegans]CAB54245.1 Putative protein tag-76 [Caenorhabditis elegans]|eukprot:NP_499193.1 Putative protein tag-76 [Caenorhabditis elegans]